VARGLDKPHGAEMQRRAGRGRGVIVNVLVSGLVDNPWDETEEATELSESDADANDGMSTSMGQVIPLASALVVVVCGT
jgi:hypothetical protein